MPEPASLSQTPGLATAAGRGCLGAQNAGIKARAAGYLRYVADELGIAGLRTSLKFPINSDIASEIVLTARDLRSQLIVMATRGRSGRTIGLLSSIPDRVIHSSPIPVRIVPRAGDDGTPRWLGGPLDRSKMGEKRLPANKAE